MKKIFILALILCFALQTSFVFADSFTNPTANAQFYDSSLTQMYSSADMDTYWPGLRQNIERDQCQEGTDFLVTIDPLGCSPAVVRSDLLEEQNVPVFCRLSGVNVNPLIKVSSIKSMTFQGDYPKDVAGVSFYPARAATRSYETLLGSPVINDLGYAVIILKKQQNESSMAKFVSGNLTATLNYDAQNAFGVGNGEMYLDRIDDEGVWQERYSESSFWSGRGYLRFLGVTDGKAKIGVYTDKDKLLRQFILKEGETSEKFYFPGFYCQAGLTLTLSNIVNDENKALLDIDGDEIQVRQGSKILNGACTVSQLSLAGNNTNIGSIKVSCQGNNPVTLSLASGVKGKFNTGGAIQNFGIGDFITKKSIDGKSSELSWYVGYAGTATKNLGSAFTNGEEFSIIVSSSKTIDSLAYTDIERMVSSLFNQKDLVNDFTSESFQQALNVRGFVASTSLFVLKTGETKGSITFNGLVDLNEGSSGTISNNNVLMDGYYNKADGAVEELVSSYPQSGDEISKFGETAIIEEIKLIDNMGVNGNKQRKTELLNKLLEVYPKSSAVNWAKQELAKGVAFDLSKSGASVYVNNNYHTISLKSFRSVSSDRQSAEFSVDGRNKGVVYLGSEINISSDNKIKDKIIVNKIDSKGMTVTYYDYYTDANGKEMTPQKSSVYITAGVEKEVVNTIKSGTNQARNNYIFSVDNIIIDEVAHVNLGSEMKTSSQTNFTYKIGIEKRAFPITPEQANKSSILLNQTIAKWQGITDKLGSLVEKWKLACLATVGVLQINSFMNNFGAESIARPEVMAMYRDKVCMDANERSACYAVQSDAIDSDVEAYSKAVNSINTEIAGKTFEQYVAGKPGTIDNIAMTDSNSGSVPWNKLQNWEQVKSSLLYDKVKSTGASSQLIDSLKQDRDRKLKSAVDTQTANTERENSLKQIPQKFQNCFFILSDYQKSSGVERLSLGTPCSISQSEVSSLILDSSNLLGNWKDKFINTGTGAVSLVFADSKYFLITAGKDSKGAFSNQGIYSVTSNDNKITITGKADKLPTSTQVISFNNEVRCQNAYGVVLEVNYYDEGSNLGFPASVPFDKVKGWYAKVSSSSSGLISDERKSYTESGEVSFFYICNIGADGVQGNSDDICQSVNVNNYKDVSDFGGCKMTGSEVDTLIRDAQAAIKQAKQQYGQTRIEIQVGSRDRIVMTGKAYTATPAYECESFMSPEDCNIMYNVCDPVICPPSRCNFGGKYPVTDVIQTGIVGSLLLCLPNFGSPSDGKVLVPVCLTGIHAGLEAYLSILKAEQACLLDAVKTGKHTGICDETTAVYKCDFFWRQAQPIVKMLLSGLGDTLTGNTKVKGGGEYATFSASLNNLEKSMSYFKNQYASTSFRAVKFGNIEEVGSTVCNNFIGASVPTSANALESWLKPESPTQFYAQFSESLLTEATVPSTSQYKVFYHIYAGKDQGINYQVYLKNPPSSAYYASVQAFTVKSGYIAAGSQASESIDFSAPSGYKELCVITNGKEECGFKSVTTSFALDYLQGQYVQDQANNSAVQTEAECIGGTPSLVGSLNVQAAAQESINPDISLRGIVRVCASTNPGATVGQATRWKNVGSCDPSGQTCYLDTQSVRDATAGLLTADKTLSAATANLNKINTNGDAFTEQGSLDKIVQINKQISNIRIATNDLEPNIDYQINPILGNVSELEAKGYLDSHKAQSILLKFRVFAKVVDSLLGRSSLVATGVPAKNLPALPSANSVLSYTVSLDNSRNIMINSVASGYSLGSASTGGVYPIFKSGMSQPVAKITNGQLIDSSGWPTSVGSLGQSLNGKRFDGTSFS